MPGTNDEYAQINLRWCNKNIRSIYGIPIRSIRVALNGIKAFYNQINIRKPNINHPDVFEFYKLSKENYPDLPEIELGDENDLNDDFLDPLAWNKNSTLGVPGLIKAWKEKKVVIVNAPGSGIADDKAIYSFVPEMIKFYLNEKPILNNIKTYLCSNEKDLNFVLENIKNLVIKPVNESGGYGIVIGRNASKNLIKKTSNVNL